MIDYSQRTNKKELLDNTDIPFSDIADNMKELDFINRHLGGHAITLQGFKKLTGHLVGNFSVCEIGCGGGDNLNVLDKFCQKNKVKASFIGVDINPDCVEFARQTVTAHNVKFIVSDYRQVNFGVSQPDIIFSSLFCHHFTDVELIFMLQWMKQNARKGFFINDLQRHPLAYHSIQLLTKFFSRSYLVKNDAPLSVLRGFKKREWESIFSKAGIGKYTIEWKWAFRHLITVDIPSGELSLPFNDEFSLHHQ